MLLISFYLVYARHTTPGPSHRGHDRENALRGEAQVDYVCVKKVLYSLVKIYLFPPSLVLKKNWLYLMGREYPVRAQCVPAM